MRRGALSAARPAGRGQDLARVPASRAGADVGRADAGAGARRRVAAGTITALATALLASALYVLACPPFGVAECAWLVPGLLFLPSERSTLRRAALRGALFGVGIGAGITHWAYSASVHYFGLSVGQGLAFVFAVWLLFSGVPFAVMLAAYAGLATRLDRALRPVLAAWLWVCAELLRTTLLTGMPWELLGDSQHERLALIQIADLVGVHGVSFLVVLVGVAGAAALAAGYDAALRRGAAPERSSRRDIAADGERAFGWREVAGPLAALASVLAYGAWALRAYTPPDSARALSVEVVQANAPSSLRWQRARAERAIAAYAAQSATEGGPAPDLVVWPETSANVYLESEPLVREEIGQVAARTKLGVLVGGPRLATDGSARNSALLLGPGGAILDAYDKQHLVPLAEYQPWSAPLAAPASDSLRFAPAADGRPLSAGDVRLGTTICYEILYPDLVRSLVRSGAEILVNLSNDSWLDAGDGAAPAQHLSMAVFRAVETRRFLVRASTSGISGVIDPLGRPVVTLPVGAVGSRRATIEPRTDSTPYVRFGDAWLLVVGAGLSAAAVRRSRRVTA
jgi:apolipoprotein N-acyltransferase